ncbi:barstar family protein [Streptomyces sp. NPDC005438]|uniref:barstar family protein n=1 Tax=Streptomyces sp. NPDC005438 TaxID=3156880 RepID=UPI0033A32012
MPPHTEPPQPPSGTTPERLLDGTLPAGVYRWPDPLDDLPSRARDAGWHTSRLSLDEVPDKESLMRACAQALRLPEYVGHNWDALEEALGDLSWWPEAPGHLLLVNGWPSYARRLPRDAATLLSVLNQVTALDPGVRPTPLTVLVD